jgi:hypothetical protein
MANRHPHSVAKAMSRLIQMQVCRKCNSKISGFSMEGYKMTMGRKLHTFSKAIPSSIQELKVFKYQEEVLSFNFWCIRSSSFVATHLKQSA